MDVISHNAKSGTSRNTLALIRNAGIEPIVVDYLVTPPSKAEIKTLIAAAYPAPEGHARYGARPL